MPTGNRILSLFLLIICLTSFSESMGQRRVFEEDVVYLKNGSILRGKIVEQIPNQSVSIEVFSGTIYTYQTSEIEKITREPSKYITIRAKMYKAYLPITYRKKGAYQQLSLGTAFNQNRWNEPTTSVNLNYRIGYHFNTHLNVGAGTGFDFYEGGTILPMFVDVWGDLFDKKITPTYMVNLGYGHGLSGTWRHNVFEGGFMSHGAFGVKFNTRSKNEFFVTIGYKAQHTYQEFEDWNIVWRDPFFNGGVTDPPIVSGTRLYQKIVWQFSWGF